MFNKKIVFTLFASLILAFTACGSDEGETEKSKDEINEAVTKGEAKLFISCVKDINVVTSDENGVVVTYTAPKGTSNSSTVNTTQTEGFASGKIFPIGTTTNSFLAEDAEGNKKNCSFKITVTKKENEPVIEVSDDKPYFVGGANNPSPAGVKWVKVESLSDEFNTDTFDDDKWHRNAANDGFGWIGRPPGLFEAKNVSVSDGNLNVTTLKFASTKVVNGKDFTHGGAIVRSKATAKQGNFYECRMKANKTVMSSTFWLAFKQNCTTGPIRKLELDIQECVGRVHSGTAEWASKWDNVYHSNTWRHKKSCDVSESLQAPGKKNLTEKNNSRFFVYGCWWKSPKEILFYLDGKFVYKIIPKTDFDLEAHITMAIETYSWNPIDEAGSIFKTGSFDDLTTKYDWVRTWELEGK